MSQDPVPPPGFDPKRKHRAGLTVLASGLPPLPAALGYEMSIPVAFWTATDCAVVAFLEFHRDRDSTFTPAMMLVTFGRRDGSWHPHPHVAGVGWSHDPIAHPHYERDLGGRALVEGGGSFMAAPAEGHPAAVAVGRAGPAVKHLALVQDGIEDRRTLQSHFGAWVVCVDRWLPYQINGLDGDGAPLASIHGPPRLPSP